ncbi:MAG TPA: hypothetical protein VGC11_12815 [Acidimicrobiia bacterium]|jgi:hypothetical protein
MGSSSERVVRGHHIRVEAEAGNERLLVDGEEVPFSRTTDGRYAIFYTQPKETLLDAAEAYVSALPERE